MRAVRKKVASSGLLLGTAWSVIRFVWDRVGDAQQAKQLAQDQQQLMAFFWKVVLSEWTGPVVAVACLLAYLYLEYWKGWTNKKRAVIRLFYDQADPNCYQPDGHVFTAIAGEGNVEHNETIYRLGVTASEQLRGCRVVLEASEPDPHDPGMHRLGLAMRPRVAVNDGEEFTVNRDAPAYVDVLQEIVRRVNPMHEWSRIRMIYGTANRGKANWFENGDYVLTFRIEGPFAPVRCRIAVRFDGRREHRRWRVVQV